jgi:hypothetical protein
VNLRLDDCAHCACVTILSGYTRETAIRELQAGSLGCWNCQEAEDDHLSCVVLYDDEEVVWDGRASCARWKRG